MSSELVLATPAEVQKFIFAGAAKLQVIRTESGNSWLLSFWPYGQNFRVGIVINKMTIRLGYIYPRPLIFERDPLSALEPDNPAFRVTAWLMTCLRTGTIPPGVQLAGIGACGRCGLRISALYCEPKCGMSARAMRNRQRMGAIEHRARAVEEFYPPFDGSIDDSIN